MTKESLKQLDERCDSLATTLAAGQPVAMWRGRYMSQKCGKVMTDALDKTLIFLKNSSFQLSATQNETLGKILGIPKFVQVQVSKQ